VIILTNTDIVIDRIVALQQILDFPLKSVTHLRLLKFLKNLLNQFLDQLILRQILILHKLTRSNKARNIHKIHAVKAIAITRTAITLIQILDPIGDIAITRTAITFIRILGLIGDIAIVILIVVIQIQIQIQMTVTTIFVLITVVVQIPIQVTATAIVVLIAVTVTIQIQPRTVVIGDVVPIAGISIRIQARRVHVVIIRIVGVMIQIPDPTYDAIILSAFTDTDVAHHSMTHANGIVPIDDVGDHSILQKGGYRDLLAVAFREVIPAISRMMREGFHAIAISAPLHMNSIPIRRLNWHQSQHGGQRRSRHPKGRRSFHHEGQR
jgi:hypothetical protein